MKEIYPTVAIDYGMKNLGLAISDSKGVMASPLRVVSITKKRNIDTVIKEILELCNEYNVKRLVVGKPQEFTKKHRKTTEKIDAFLVKLKSFTNIPIVTYDEAFSTVDAQNMLISSGQNIRSSKKKIDSIAATLFLQEFLNFENKKNEK